MRPSTDDGISCDLRFSRVLPAVEKLRSDEVLVAGMSKINKLTFGSARAWLRELFGKQHNVPITAGIPQSLSPFPQYYRGRYPILVELPQQSSPLPWYYRNPHPRVNL